MQLKFVSKSTLKSYGQTKISVAPPPYGLFVYIDSNYVNNPEDYKSIMHNCLYVNKTVVL